MYDARMAAHFLVLEDHVPLAQTLASVVRCVGDAHIALTVEEGIDTIAEREHWSGFLIDVLMPDGNGLDVLAWAREHGHEAPALVLTAMADPKTINRTFELRGRYLVKPADPLGILRFLSDAAHDPFKDRFTREWASRYDLTETEISLLSSAIEGSERDQLAFERGVSTTTLKKHVNNLLRKTGDESLLAAAARLLRERDK
jgi:DNA-binding NarL/FixJ family response regulator